MKTKYIDEGSYGCVIKPAIECSNLKIKRRNTIAKLFKEKKYYLGEIKNYNKISNILKDKNLIVNLKSYCKKKISEYDKVTYKKCLETFNGDSEQIIYQIIYEYGGINLWFLFSNYNITFKKVFLSLDNIFKTIIILNKNNYLHQDIRPPNILYLKNSVKLIDYGLLIKRNEFNDYLLFHKKKENYQYPPELNSKNYYSLYEYIMSKSTNKMNDNNNKYMNYIYISLKKIVKDYYNSNTTNNKIDLGKHDIYMFGIVLLDILVDSIRLNKLNLNLNNLKLIFKFITKIIDTNTANRYSPEKAYTVYKKIVKNIKKNTP